MREDIIMPKMGMTMTEGQIVKWLKIEGEKVSKGEPVANIETDKIANTVNAPTDGILHITEEEGTELPVAGVMGYIEAET